MNVCDECGKNEATYSITEVDKDGQSHELHLCLACAEKRGLLAEKKLSLAEVFAALLKERVVDDDRQLVCPRCGLTFADFRRLGRLGCARCYTSFAPKLLPIIRRVQGATRHAGHKVSSGQKPASAQVEITRLRKALSKAITDEEYEKAAQLRDQLRAAEEGTDHE